MKKEIIELKEYDLLTTNEEASEQIGAVCVNQTVFTKLENMILTFQDTKADDAIDFLTLSSKRNVGKVIRAKNYVGVLQLADTQLQILPKIHGGTQEDSKKTFLKMLKALKNFPSKTFHEANLHTEKMPIFEIFIRLYIKEVQQLVKRGLKSAYYEVEDNLRVFKGKMNFAQQIKHNAAHKERFYMQYDDFGLNRPENRLIKTTLAYLVKQSTSVENVRELRKLLVSFELVEDSQAVEKDFAQVKIDRHIKEYKTALEWANIFLHKQSFTTFSGSAITQALLFPMNQVFEDFVGHYVKKMLMQSDWSVSLQDRTYHLFERQFALKPDIVLRNEKQGRTIILDTKWKLLKNKPASNYGISQADMYQMYAYAKKYHTNEIWLLYPITDEFKPNEDIRFTSDDGVQVNVFFVNCHAIEESLQLFKEKCLSNVKELLV